MSDHKHYFVGGGMIQVHCMMCNQSESRSIHYPDKNLDDKDALLRELVDTLEIIGSQGCYDRNCHKDEIAREALSRAQAAMKEKSK